MQPHALWRGYLKLSLVVCAVEIATATSDEDIHLRMLDRETGNRLRRQYVRAADGKLLDQEDIVRGYPHGDDKFLLIEEEEIDAVEIEASHTLNLDSFVKRSSLSPIFLDTPYVLLPADEVSREAFVVIRDAMRRENLAGITRLVLARREHPALIEPFEEGLLLTTLRTAEAVRDPSEIFACLADAKPDKKKIKPLLERIDQQSGAFDAKALQDGYELRLRKLIRSKRGRARSANPIRAEDGGKVVDLFAALKKSLASGGETKPGKGAGGSRGKPIRRRKAAP